jgi:hypothetical protein
LDAEWVAGDFDEAPAGARVGELAGPADPIDVPAVGAAEPGLGWRYGFTGADALSTRESGASDVAGPPGRADSLGVLAAA